MRVTLTRRNITLAGGVGVIAGIIAIAAIIAFRPAEWPALLAPYPIVHWAIFVFLGGISLAEMPLMIFTLRKLIADNVSPVVILLIVVAFVFFAGVYALPNLLLTEKLWMGITLSMLIFLRWILSVIFLHIEEK